MKPRNYFAERREKAHNDYKEAEKSLVKALECTAKVTYYVNDTPRIIYDLAKEFKQKTALTKTDEAILFVAIGLQLLRQYMQEKLTAPEERPGDQEAAGEHNYSKDERNRGYYHPTLKDITDKPVPFDVIDGSAGRLTGGGSLGHRGKTVGHDPLLGLIVGTANIATATVTIAEGKFKYNSYHVRTNERNRDSFAENASTALVMHYTIDKVVNNPTDKYGDTGREKVQAAFVQEVKHLASDVYSKNSLPLPILSSISPELASKLADYGFDCANIIYVSDQLRIASKQAGYAIFINFIISLFHGLFYDGKTEMDKKLYEVRTRKIVMYSNIVASAVNLGACGLAAYRGDYKAAYENLDLGGIAVTVYRIITDTKFINQVRKEFVIGGYRKEIDNILNELENTSGLQVQRESLCVV